MQRCNRYWFCLQRWLIKNKNVKFTSTMLQFYWNQIISVLCSLLFSFSQVCSKWMRFLTSTRTTHSFLLFIDFDWLLLLLLLLFIQFFFLELLLNVLLFENTKFFSFAMEWFFSFFKLLNRFDSVHKMYNPCHYLDFFFILDSFFLFFAVEWKVAKI